MLPRRPACCPPGLHVVREGAHVVRTTFMLSKHDACCPSDPHAVREHERAVETACMLSFRAPILSSWGALR